METTRRTLLAAGLGCGVIVAGGGVWLGLKPTVMRTPPAALLVFTPTEYSILAAIADAFYPGGDGLPSGSEAGVPARVEAVMARKHPADAAEFQQVLALVENALVAALLDQRTQTFTASSPAVQVAALDAWRVSGLLLRRTAFKALHGLCAGAYWSLPSAYQISGYAGPPDFGQKGAPKPRVFEPIPTSSGEPPVDLAGDVEEVP